MSNSFPNRNGTREFHSKTRLVACFAALLGTFTIISGCSLLPAADQPLKPPLVKPAEARIVTVEPEMGTIQRSVSGMAVFESVRMSSSMFTESGGRVGEVLVSAGDEVKAGDVLMRLDTSEMQLTLLQRRLEVEKKRLALDEAKETGDPRRVNIAELELEIANLALSSIEDIFANKELHAEIDGIVTFAADLEPGDMAEDYRTLFMISDPKQMRLAFSISSGTQSAEIQLGLEAEIGFKGQSYLGKVVQTPSSAPYENDERLRERYARTLYIDVDSLPSGVKIGESATVRIITAMKENAMILPKNAVRKMFGRTFVQVLEGESRREFDVETGIETATEIEIVSGLELGVQVIIP